MAHANTSSMARYIPGSYWYTYGSAALDLAGAHVSQSAGDRPSIYLVGSEMDASQSNLATPRARYESARRRRSRFLAAADFALFAVLFLLVLAVAAYVLGDGSFGSDAALSEGQAAMQVEVVSVLEGDTLWSISQRNAVEGMTTRELVEWIVKHNGLTGSELAAGQIIEVPSHG